MRIYITGSAGSGKTTYARQLQEELDLPLFSTDDLYDSVRKSMHSKGEILKRIPLDSHWIIEGAYYMPEYIRSADKVIYIKIGYLKTVYRILNRWLKNRELRKKYTFLQTLKLVYTTIRDKRKSEDIDLDTQMSSHYTEKDRYRLCKGNSKKFVVIKG